MNANHSIFQDMHFSEPLENRREFTGMVGHACIDFYNSDKSVYAFHTNGLPQWL